MVLSSIGYIIPQKEEILLSSNENEIDILTDSGWINEGTIYSAPE